MTSKLVSHLSVCLFLMFAVGCAVKAVLEVPAEVAATALEQVVQQLDSVVPAYSIVIVKGQQTILNRQFGVVSVDTGVRVTPDTAFYIASQTKAFVGRMATQLSQQGILPLETKLSDIWPGSVFSSNTILRNKTLADALNHQLPINAFPVTFLEAYVGALPQDYYLPILEATTTARTPGFEYDNLGYSVYAAALQQQTGKSWQQWLDEQVLQPLGMVNSGTSNAKLKQVVQPHQLIDIGNWHALPNKTDDIMHAAGGMSVSSNDMASWLKASLKHKNWQPLVDLEQRYTLRQHDAYDLPCDGYALGWNVCYLNEHKVYMHGGGYTGSQSLMAVVPGLEVGIAVAASSDHVTHWLNRQLIVNYIKDVTGEAFTPEKQNELVAKMHEFRNSLIARRQLSRSESLAAEVFKGAPWQATASELGRFAGHYVSDELPVAAEITFKDGQLIMQIGALVRQLKPITTNSLAAYETPVSDYEPVIFTRDAQGQVSSIRYMDTVLTR